MVVLALIGVADLGGAPLGGTTGSTTAARGRQPRLAVIDAAAVDGRRQLVIIRRDNVEHLLMIGGPSDVVVEQNIVRAVPVAPPREARSARGAGAELPFSPSRACFAAACLRASGRAPEPAPRASPPRFDLPPRPRPYAGSPRHAAARDALDSSRS